MGVFFAIAQKNEDKEKARKMIKNYVIGLVRILLKLYTKTKLMIIALRFALCHTGEHSQSEGVSFWQKTVKFRHFNTEFYEKQPFSLESGCFFTLLKAVENRKMC